MTCPRCDRPEPTPELRNHPGGCECAACVSVCWGGCEPIDWRERALRAEARVAELERPAPMLPAVCEVGS